MRLRESAIPSSTDSMSEKVSATTHLSTWPSEPRCVSRDSNVGASSAAVQVAHCGESAERERAPWEDSIPESFHQLIEGLRKDCKPSTKAHRCTAHFAWPARLRWMKRRPRE